MSTMLKARPTLVPTIDCDVMDERALTEYREVADAVGLAPADLLIEEFRVFLAKHDIPTFSIAEVVRYMDELTARDNPSKLGWQWHPVRARDGEVDLLFGTPSVSVSQFDQGLQGIAQEFSGLVSQQAFNTPGMQQRFLAQQNSNSFVPTQWPLPYPGVQPASDYYHNRTAKLYARTLPLHALKKVALVEREFGAGKVSFLVTDYVTQPHIVINPDPFLMAVVPNAAIGQGKGRFIIDVWDEPGFGIGQMVR